MVCSAHRQHCLEMSKVGAQMQVCAGHSLLWHGTPGKVQLPQVGVVLQHQFHKPARQLRQASVPEQGPVQGVISRLQMQACV